MSTLRTLMSAGSSLDYTDNMPPFDTIEKKKDFEIRTYHDNKFITINNQSGANTDEEETKEIMKDEKPNDSIVMLIWRLIKYTQGHNDKKTNMKFHFPVFVQVDVTSSEDENDKNNLITIMATLPKEFQVSLEKANPEEAPISADPDIKIDHIKSYKCYVRKFSGFATESDFKKETAKLVASLESEAKKTGTNFNYKKSRVICLQYDPPYKLFSRRNEVILVAL